MKIEALCRRMCQAASKVFIFKSILISVAMMCACLASVQNADALSVQLQWGVGDDSDFREWGFFSYLRADLNIFLYDSDMFDFFIGREYATSKHRPGGDDTIIVSSNNYNASVLGMRFKPFEKRRVNPYVLLGILSGTVHYNAYANKEVYPNVSYDLISISRQEASFTTYRAGLGLDIAIIDKLAIEVEANCSDGVPATYATVSATAPGKVSRSDMTTNFDGSRSRIVNLAVGVKYYF